MIAFLAALALQAAPPSFAPACRPGRPPAAPLAGWGRARPVGTALTVGQAGDIPVRPLANVRLRVMPSKPLSGSHYASTGFAVTRAGRYAVAVGGARSAIRPLWLDVAGPDDRPLTSVAHAHGPDCTGISKIVEFDLGPGRYTLLVTGLTGDAQPVRALVIRKR